MRTTDGKGRVADLTLAEVQALDAGSKMGPQFAGVRIPTAEAFLARYGGRVGIRLEVKAPYVEAQLLQIVRKADLLEKVEFTSFSWESVEKLLALAPDARVGWLIQAVDEETIGRSVGAGARFLSAKASSLTPESVQRGRAAGLEVGAWGVDDDELLAHVVNLGVDAFTSNWPDKALKMVAKLPA